MKKKVHLLLAVIFLHSFIVKAEWIPFGKQSTPAPPKITLLSNDNSGAVLKVDLYGFHLNQLNTASKQYQRIDLLSESFTVDPGSPEVPYIAKVLAIPDQAGISIEVIETGEVQTFSNILLPPARESWVEGSPETLYVENQEVYGSSKNYPGSFARMEQPAVFRDFRISRVSVFPVRYSPSKKQLEVVSSVTVRINYNEGSGINPKTSGKKPISSSFSKLYKSFIFNYQDELSKSFESKEDAGELMLCIMPDDFVDSFLPYASWKKQTGVDIHITKFSDIGANPNEPSIIKNHIEDAYFNWDIPPTYVLLIGDGGVCPVYSSGNENYFVELEGDDYFPELMIGRLPIQSAYALQVMLNKLTIYEQTPDTSDTNWFMKGICCSNDAYASQVYTKEFAADRMLIDGGFISVDEMMSDPGCTYSVQDVVAAINEGRSYLNYRGEGWSSGWWASCTPMNISDVEILTNGPRFPFVTSIGCGVAMFSSGNCFGEAWMEIGTLSNPKGACAFIGPCGNTHTTYNNKIDKGIYVGMFQEGMDTPGQALVRGRLYMYNVFGNTSSVENHYRKYLTLGDASIHVWKDIPKEIDVEFPSSIPIGNNTVEFTVIHTSNSQAVVNAVVCVSGNDFFEAGYTDEYGKAYIDINVLDLDTFNVTVRGGDVYPFQGTLIVAPATGPYVIKDSYTINDALGGNGNGMLDYGETNLLSITMANVGINQANNVIVSLSTSNPYITLTDSIADYGNIAAGSTSVVTDGFAYSVANDIPDLEPVSFEILATSGSLTWTSYIFIEAHAPVLVYDDISISDPLGNNDGTFDPGETVDLIISIENSGTSTATNVIGDIEIIDPFVTLNTTQAIYNDIAGGSVTSAVFSASADISTPAGYLAEFLLTVTADLGIGCSGDPFVIVGQIPVLILDLDENSNSAPAMETALEAQGITFETVPSFPPDLNLYRVIFVCLGIFADNHVLTSNEGQILADYLNNGGSIYMEGGDTWYYNSQTAVHPMFSINPTADGSSDMSTVVGQDGTFTEGMSFNYNGDNSWMDHIEPEGSAIKIFDNASPLYGTGVAYDDGDYKTIGTSHEFGGLTDGTFPSTKEELMAQYLNFLGISLSVQALFSSRAVEVCTEDVVDFYDLSSGEIVSWLWTFEGGMPETSTYQNPSVAYMDPGTFDVTLTVSDGIDTSTYTQTDLIYVLSIPGTPPVPAGLTEVCANGINTDYTTTGLPDISTYNWLLEPAEAGTVSGNGQAISIFWTNGYLGDVTLKVAGENDCGLGPYSDVLDITLYLPEVTIEPFDWVCVDWPAFELAGGMPEGGEYSGPGIDNGWFDPGTAGLGEHTITYTYFDPNNCENYATETIWVDPCTGIDDNSDPSGITVYPNPSNGELTVRFDHDAKFVDIKIFNVTNTVVYNEIAKDLTERELNLNLGHLAKGVYFIRLKTNKKEKLIRIILH